MLVMSKSTSHIFVTGALALFLCKVSQKCDVYFSLTSNCDIIKKIRIVSVGREGPFRVG